MPDRPPLAGSFLDKARMTFKVSFHFENVALALTAIQKGRVVGFEAFGPRTYSASRPADSLCHSKMHELKKCRFFDRNNLLIFMENEASHS